MDEARRCCACANCTSGDFEDAVCRCCGPCGYVAGSWILPVEKPAVAA